MGEFDKRLCQHGPNGKCLNCIQSGMQNAKHIAFDAHLRKVRANCKNHPPEAKCTNCIFYIIWMAEQDKISKLIYTSGKDVSVVYPH